MLLSAFRKGKVRDISKRNFKKTNKSCRQVGYDQLLHFIADVSGDLELLGVVVVVEGTVEKEKSVSFKSDQNVENVFPPSLNG